METNSLITQPLHIYFRSKDTQSCPENLVSKKLNCRIRVCDSWGELSLAISNQPKSLVFHIDMVKRQGVTISEFMMMLETLIKYTNTDLKPNIGVAIESTTPVSVIKELQKHKITGILLSYNSFAEDLCIESIQAIIRDESYWPKDIIKRLPGNNNKIKNKNTQCLTSRQQQVFDLISNRGLSNKQIARVLNISESTVKIHVSAVMKNLCVRNRTQLALTK